MQSRSLFFAGAVLIPLAGEAGELPALLHETGGIFAVCDSEALVRQMFDVRRYGRVVAEDFLQITEEQSVAYGTPGCRAERVDVQTVRLEGMFDLGIMFPVDAPPMTATIFHLVQGNRHLWILMFFPTKGA